MTNPCPWPTPCQLHSIIDGQFHPIPCNRALEPVCFHVPLDCVFRSWQQIIRARAGFDNPRSRSFPRLPRPKPVRTPYLIRHLSAGNKITAPFLKVLPLFLFPSSFATTPFLCDDLLPLRRPPFVTNLCEDLFPCAFSYRKSSRMKEVVAKEGGLRKGKRFRKRRRKQKRGFGSTPRKVSPDSTLAFEIPPITTNCQ
jgi:hypothetical protein